MTPCPTGTLPACGGRAHFLQFARLAACCAGLGLCVQAQAQAPVAASSAPSATAAQPAETVAAQAAAQRWLRLIDEGNALAAWQGAAAPFRAAVTAVQWQQATQAVRAPLGAMKSRREKSTQFMRSLPGAPDGQYAVLQYDTVYEAKQQAMETLTLVLEGDGAWRPVGYFIK